MKPLKKRSYQLNTNYKEKVHLELVKMLEVEIIEPVEEPNWVSPMVVHEKKKKGEIRISIELQKINESSLQDPFLMSFTIEVLDNVGR